MADPDTQPPPRILVTGSREWTDTRIIRDALEQAWYELLPAGEPVLVHGDCPTGADRIARDIWRGRGHVDEPHPAAWDTHGRSAGFRRNADMAKLGADLCLAFPTVCRRPGCDRPAGHYSHGTAMMIELARRAGIDVRVFEER